MQCAGPVAERRSFWTGTPEIYFSKAIDNSRLVKVEDPRRNREMKQFGTALGVCSCSSLLMPGNISRRSSMAIRSNRRSAN